LEEFLNGSQRDIDIELIILEGDEREGAERIESEPAIDGDEEEEDYEVVEMP
jgi:hypothetical protein